jgi:hypothetical protein
VEFTWRAGGTTGSRLARWQIVFWSQCGAMAFNLAALVMAVLLLGFTDLAFAWSTTFDIEPATVFNVTTVLSMPWQTLFPDAVPSADLVESSRWFRLDQAGAAASSSHSAQVLTGWWPFLLMMLLVYGFLPRVLFAVFAVWRLRAATRALLLEDAGVAALLDRMRNELVDAPASPPDRQASPAIAAPAVPKAPVRGGVAALVWSEALSHDRVARRARDRLGVVVSGSPAAAGGGMALAEDQVAADVLVRQEPALVVVFVRAWEPPLLELLDFLKGLRRRLPAAHFLIHPVPESGAIADAEEVNTWQRSIAALADKGIHVDAGHGTPVPEDDA